MKIETKFNLGEEVFVVLDAKPYEGECSIIRGTVREIVINKDNTVYYIEGLFEEVTEDNMISTSDLEVEVKLWEEVELITRRKNESDSN